MSSTTSSLEPLPGTKPGDFQSTRMHHEMMEVHAANGFLVPYNITQLYAPDWVQHPEMVVAQLRFMTLLIEGKNIPPHLKKLISGTGMKMKTFRPCLRYAQDRVAEVVIAVTELDLICERRGYKAAHGKRFDVYRGAIENNTYVPRAQHIGDETWLKTASPKELVFELVDAIEERYYMERVEDNMLEFIERQEVSAWRKTLGIDSVYVKPERKEEDLSKALVKYTGGGAKKGGRGGGGAGGSDAGSFRGWK